VIDGVGVILAPGWDVGLSLLLLLRGSVFKELGSGMAGEGAADEEGSSAMERECLREI
jgi:hypothetical protein